MVYLGELWLLGHEGSGVGVGGGEGGIKTNLRL